MPLHGACQVTSGRIICYHRVAQEQMWNSVEVCYHMQPVNRGMGTSRLLVLWGNLKREKILTVLY